MGVSGFFRAVDAISDEEDRQPGQWFRNRQQGHRNVRETGVDVVKYTLRYTL